MSSFGYTINYYKFLQGIESLERVIKGYDEGIVNASENVKETLEAGVVQAFEYTYELARVYLDRWLKKHFELDFETAVTRRERFRLAQKHRIIADADKWQKYYEKRNLTVHTYDGEVEMQVIDIVPEFLSEVKKLYSEMKKHND